MEDDGGDTGKNRQKEQASRYNRPSRGDSLKKCRVKDGLCVVFCPHTTAGLTINENADPDVVKDILKHLEKLVPNDPSFAHSEGNSDAHIKASLRGSSVTVLVENGKLFLGT